MLNKPNNVLFTLCWMLCIIRFFQYTAHGEATGPDPWNYDENDIMDPTADDKNVPPDLRIPRKIKPQTDKSYGSGEWFYRRILSIMINGHQIQNNEDGGVDISLQMKLGEKEWETLKEYLSSPGAFSEDMFRRSLGYVEQSIYKPNIATKVIVAWSDYIHMSLTEYRMEIMWTLAAIGISILVFWMWRNMSHKNVKIIIFIALYLYEVFVSYKEAEQKELDMFVGALNNCKWRFWLSTCEVPRPDPLVFMKHMNPTKIGIRMFTNLVSEPLIVLSDTAKTMSHGITDGLWYPFDILMYGVFITFFNVLLLLFMIMIIFNFILNIPFKLDFLLFSVGLGQRKYTRDTSDEPSQNAPVNNTNNNAISPHTFDKVLDVIAKALHRNADNPVPASIQHASNTNPRTLSISEPSSSSNGMKRSASTGRLPNLRFEYNEVTTNIKKRNVPCVMGGGDGH